MSNEKIIEKHMFFYRFQDDQLSSSVILCNALFKHLLEDNKLISAMLDKYFKVCQPSEFWGIKKMSLKTFSDFQGVPVLELVKFEDVYKFALLSFGQFLSPLSKKDLKDPAIIKTIMDFFAEPEEYIKKAINEAKLVNA
jgi:hypothetical protein